MTDHCHILLQGKSEQADTLRAVRNFKQKSFYDHILRSDEEIDKHMRYYLENPVRKEIIEDWKEYPWKGSMVFDLNEWCP
jgi:REP element-mobilizing transposase RayT